MECRAPPERLRGSPSFGASTLRWSRSRQRPRVGRGEQASLKKTQLPRHHTQAVGTRGAGDRAAYRGSLGGEGSEWRLQLTLSQRRPQAAAGGSGICGSLGGDRSDPATAVQCLVFLFFNL